MPHLIEPMTGHSLVHEELSRAFESDMPIQQALAIARRHYTIAPKEPLLVDRARNIELPANTVRR